MLLQMFSPSMSPMINECLPEMNTSNQENISNLNKGKAMNQMMSRLIHVMKLELLH